MGHYFGLYHTFEVIWGEEDPNESNCNLTGDLLCDTPADTITGSVNSQCQYLGPYTRNYYGTTYTVHPLVDNIMSYYKTYNKECRTSFTTDQYARMTTWAQDPNNQGKYPCPPPRLPPPPVLSIEVYPIPAESFLTIKAANANLPMEFRIIDITGKVVYQNSLTSLLSQVDISGLSPGMYITQVMDSNNKSLLIKKIIKTSNP